MWGFKNGLVERKKIRDDGPIPCFGHTLYTVRKRGFRSDCRKNDLSPDDEDESVSADDDNDNDDAVANDGGDNNSVDYDGGDEINRRASGASKVTVNPAPLAM